MGKKENACVNCGQLFDPGKHKEKKTCSKECLKEHREKIKEERIKKSKESIQKKYGVDHVSKIPGFGKKVKETKERKHGDENFNNREQAKKQKKLNMEMKISTIPNK